MSDIIKLLPDHVANQIAAGEVVQRPASVVKELLENAVDAKASDIKLIIKDAGKILIQVIDDGIGMSMTDIRMAFERHTTSKIRKTEDIFNIQTKGFRGEALASIVAVSQLESFSRKQEDNIGTKIKIEGGKVIMHENAVFDKGTSIAVKNLFYNIPARRNFIKSDKIEMKHILDEFQRVALAHPEITFRFYNNGKELYRLPATKIRQRIVNILGGKTNEKLVPIQEQTDLLTVSGFISKPEYAKKTRGEQYFFVNNRFIKSSYLNHAVIKAFEGLIPHNSYPSYVIFLSIPASFVDINIHPTKTEVKFEEDKEIYFVLKSAVRYSLGKYNTVSSIDFELDTSLDIPHSYKNKTPQSPTIVVDPNFNPFLSSEDNDNNTNKKYNFIEKPKRQSWESLYTQQQNVNKLEIESKLSLLKDNNNFPIERNTGKTFQIHQKYIITTIKSGVIIINQCRAHQRILYEKFIQQLEKKKILSQQLLFPICLSYTIAQISTFGKLIDYLRFAGFSIEIDKEQLKIKSIPVDIKEEQIPSFIDDILENSEYRKSSPEKEMKNLLAKSLCKTTSIKSGYVMEKIQQEDLVDRLFSCQDSQMSPFNEKIYTILSINEIEQKF